MLLDLSPLRKYRDFRFLFSGQLVSFFGSMMSYVALPYQVFQLTHSSLAVGMIGLVQLLPLLFTALVGGAFADAMDRRKLLLFAESGLTLCSLGLTLNAFSAQPSLLLIYVLAGLASGINGFHRPANNAMVPRMVAREDIPAVSALGSFRSTFAQVGGPAVAGILIASRGVGVAFLLDVLSFLFSLSMLWRIPPMPPVSSGKSLSPGIQSIAEGLKYAGSRQELVGTYLVDLIAMIFGMPNALFPALSEGLGGAWVLGWLYSAPAVGAFLAALLSRWCAKVQRQGRAVAIAAGVWGLAITAFGFSRNLGLSLLFLAIAGGADMISVILRKTIWDGTVPDQFRGRLAGVEMLSYMSGPLLGNAESGWMAAAVSVDFSVISGGVLCVLGVGACAFALPRFWNYRSK